MHFSGHIFLFLKNMLRYAYLEHFRQPSTIPRKIKEAHRPDPIGSKQEQLWRFDAVNAARMRQYTINNHHSTGRAREATNPFILQ